MTSPRRRPARYPVAEFYRNTSFTGASWSADGATLIVSADLTGIWNVYAIPATGGEMKPLTTAGDDATYAVDCFPGDQRVLCTSSRGGSEMWHLYVREPDGTLRDVTPGDGHQAGFLGWAADERSLLVRMNARDRGAFDVHRIAIDGYERSLVFTNEDGRDIGAVSRDGRWVVLVEVRTSSDRDLWLHDRETGTTRRISSLAEHANNSPAGFAPDGSRFLFTSDAGREFLALWSHDLASGEASLIHERSWDVTGASFSRSGKHLVVTVNENSRVTQHLLDARTLAEVPIARAPEAVVTALTVSHDDQAVAFYATDGSAPSELYAGPIGSAPARLTSALSSTIQRTDLVRPQVTSFKARDGVDVPGILYRPHQASAAAPAPAIVLVHGGPGGQATVGFDPLTQALANAGYVVFDINHRGSSGYGKRFAAMQHRRHGEADLADVIDSRRMLSDTGHVDPSRIGIMGMSYGGFMVLAALTLHPDAFAVGVDMFGVANWFRTLENLPAHLASARAALYAEMGDPVADAERLRRISPVFQAEHIRVPLMVLQGANDSRVLQVESDEIVAAARQNGVDVEYIVFPDEGHGFQKKENKVRGYTAVIEFLDRHLREGAAWPAGG